MNMFDASVTLNIENYFVVPNDQAEQLSKSQNVIVFKRTGRNIQSLYSLYKASKKAIEQFKPDLIFFHSTFSLSVLTRLYMARMRIPFLYCPHGWAAQRYSENKIKRTIVAYIEGRLCGLANVVLNISHNDRDFALQRGYAGQHIVIENAMPDSNAIVQERPYATNENKINLLFVGRFDRQKGLDVLLNAYLEVAKLRPDLHLHIVGASVLDQVEGSENRANIQEIQDRITFHSWVCSQDIPAYYEHADLLVMPSRWEGLPMVLIEALRAGTPALLSNASGMGILIENGKSGFVVKEPTVQAFALALQNIKKTQLHEMRFHARALYERRYTSERFNQEFQELLRQIGVL